MLSCVLVSFTILDRGVSATICGNRDFSPMRIFHRIDDVRMCSREMVTMLDFFAETVEEFVVAAIPCGFSREMACRIREYDNCAVYQHGYRHVNRVPAGWCDEFPDTFPERETRRWVSKGKHRLEELLQCAITGYVPPWNNAGEKTIGVLADLGFTCYSAQKNHTRPFKNNRDVDVDVVASYTPRIVYKTLEDVLRQIEALGRESGEVGILYHFKNASAESLAAVFDFVREVEALHVAGRVGS